MRRVRVVAAGGVLAAELISFGCVRPATFSRGEEIPMGPGTVRVSNLEFSGAEGSTRVISVYLTWSRIPDEARRRLMVSFLTRRIDLEDHTGKRYHARFPMPADWYLAQQSLQAAERSVRQADPWSSRSETIFESVPLEWVVLFRVPEAGEGFTLLIDNPDRRSGQPRTAAVPLGR